MTLPIRPPLKPMLAKLQEQIPSGDDWVYEPKWDGFRALVFRDEDQIRIASRNDRPLGRYFPEVESLLLDALPGRCVVDGEIILPSDNGLEFELLQLRLHPAASRVNLLAEQTPASFVVFDVLALEDHDLREGAFAQRLEALSELFARSRPEEPGAPATEPGPRFFLTPCTSDAEVAAAWFDDLEELGLDGIIAKRLSLPYVAGERVMVKVKHRRTADCVVGGFRPHKQGGVGSLLLGLYDDGVLRYVGHTSSFGNIQRNEIAETLEPLRSDDRSFGGEWGPGGPSRWSQGRDVEWISVEPKLVCEVSYDYMQSGYRFRHAARFLGWRDDKRPEECTFDQVRST